MTAANPNLGCGSLLPLSIFAKPTRFGVPNRAYEKVFRFPNSRKYLSCARDPSLPRAESAMKDQKAV